VSQVTCRICRRKWVDNVGHSGHVVLWEEQLARYRQDTVDTSGISRQPRRRREIKALYDFFAPLEFLVKPLWSITQEFRRVGMACATGANLSHDISVRC